jgi:hypothetical protein|tara:strand:+ start:212 stop:424 length:213 start_codon:yes stop_codon:yes gene_type:complete
MVKEEFIEKHYGDSITLKRGSTKSNAKFRDYSWNIKLNRNEKENFEDWVKRVRDLDKLLIKEFDKIKGVS